MNAAPGTRRLAMPRSAACAAMLLVSPAAMVLVSLAGCAADFEKTALGRHVTQDLAAGKVEARQKWDAVRSDVKLQIVRQHLDTGRLDEAQKFLEPILAMSPADARPYVLAARLRLEQGRVADARAAVEAALRLGGSAWSPAPTDAEANYYAGIVAQRYGELTEALARYEAAAAAVPNNGAYLLAHAETLAALDRPADALALIESRLNDFDDDVPLRVLAARAARSLHLRTPTAQYLREALQLAKGDTMLAVHAAEALLWAGQCAEAIDLLTPIVAAHDANPGTTLLLAEACLACNKPLAALSAVAALIDDDDDAQPVALLIAGRACLAAGRIEEADGFVQRLRRASPDSAAVRMLGAYVALRRGRPDDALRDIEQALRLGGVAFGAAPAAGGSQPSGLAALWCLRGRALEATERFDEARAAYEQALQADPDCKLSRRLLDRLNRQARAATVPAVTLEFDLCSLLHEVP